MGILYGCLFESWLLYFRSLSFLLMPWKKMEMAQVIASSTFGGDSDEIKGFGLAHLSYEPVNEALTLTPTFKIINL